MKVTTCASITARFASVTMLVSGTLGAGALQGQGPTTDVERAAASTSAGVRLAQADSAAKARTVERIADLKPGTDYRLIEPAAPTSTAQSRVEVVEIFRYSCSHCMRFQPHVEQWLGEKADYVDFLRVPASFHPIEKLHARAYYTAELLGVLDEIHADFFREIHVERNPLASEAALADFFARYGIDQETFDKTFNSFAVHTKIQGADELVRRYRVTGTPNVVINGKYLTDGTKAGTYKVWFANIDQLAAREHATE